MGSLRLFPVADTPLLALWRLLTPSAPFLRQEASMNHRTDS